jgi:eukaryotic-like serine/threonine-protein kinase
MEHQTQQTDVDQQDADSPATFGGLGPRGNDDYQTDYAPRVGGPPDHDVATHPMRAGAPRGPGALGQYSFLEPAVEPGELGRLGNYRVLRLLGQGGMAFVFLAEDIDLHRKVALKVMKPDLEGDADAWHRFLREARIMASIKHEHLVPVFQVARAGRVHYLAMELLEGETLDSWCNRVGQAKASDVVRLARGIASGLATIHRQGLVHRDIKPGNLWLEGPRHHVKILDLGLARSVVDDARFTQTGIIVGTPAFMSPEQARGEGIDARSDLFSLGAVLYRLAAGHLPFEAPTTMGVLSELAVCNPRPLREHNPGLPRSLEKLIMQLLAKDPEQRPASADAVIEQLQRIEARRADTREERADELEPTDRLPQGAQRAEAPQRPRGAKKKRAAQPRYAIYRWVAVSVAIAAFVAVLVGISVILTIGIMAWAGTANPPGAAKVFLSDLKPSDVSKLTPPEPGKGPPMFKKGPPEFKDFKQARINEQNLPNGILMHPVPTGNGGLAKQSYALDGKYTTFHAEVSLNDGPFKSESPLTFTVLGDGQPLWKSQQVTTQADRQTCTVSVKNVRVLTVQVDCPGEPRGAHAVWVDPHLVK